MAAAATTGLLISLVLASMSLVFLATTVEAVGVVVAVRPDSGATAGQPVRAVRPLLVVEYPDRNGQFRRFDEKVRGEAPAKGAEIAVRYRMGPPVEARIANYWTIWEPATIAGAVGLGLGLVAEELLRNRRRFAEPAGPEPRSSG